MRITKGTAKKIFKDAGADKVSDEAVSELCEILTKYAYDISNKAVKFAAHAKRKTIKKSDVQLAK